MSATRTSGSPGTASHSPTASCHGTMSASTPLRLAKNVCIQNEGGNETSLYVTQSCIYICGSPGIMSCSATASLHGTRSARANVNLLQGICITEHVVPLSHFWDACKGSCSPEASSCGNTSPLHDQHVLIISGMYQVMTMFCSANMAFQGSRWVLPGAPRERMAVQAQCLPSPK